MKVAGLTLTELRVGLVELASPGRTDLPLRSLWRVGFVAISIVTTITHLIGGGIVLFNLIVIDPLPPLDDRDAVRQANLIAAAVYMAIAFPTGSLVAPRLLRRVRDWMHADRPATPDEVRELLRGPTRLFQLQAGLWLGAAIAFGLMNARWSVTLGWRVAVVVALSGLVTASCAYLFTERILRGAAVRAVSTSLPRDIGVPGVATRAVLAWALGTGLPVLGLVAEGLFVRWGITEATSQDLALAVIVSGLVAFAVGLLAVILAARATADPVDAVTEAMSEVRAGRFDIRVPVYDGTQLGQLQLGFNRMVAGLAERERLRRAFGSYVDPDVAEHVLREGIDAPDAVAGSEVDVTIMFVDVRDFTAFASESAARDVVTALNDLFEWVVPLVHDHGGRVDKFVGDGLMAVFGAPRPVPDHADSALAAAVAIARRGDAGRGLRLGIGLNSGMVVAGNIGTAERREYGVIGDAVNVAARVEAATRHTGDVVLVSEATRERLAPGTVGSLTPRPGVHLKGKAEPVTLYAAA